MRSNLTRLVFNRILSGEPIIFRSCPHRRTATFRHANRLRPACVQGRLEYRSFFTNLWSEPPKRKKGKPDFPGSKVLAELSQAEMLDSRRPEFAQLKAALEIFFEEKDRRGEGIDEVNARHVVQSLKHLSKHGMITGQWRLSTSTKEAEHFAVGMDTLRKAMKMLARVRPSDTTSAHQDLALYILRTIEQTLADMQDQENQKKEVVIGTPAVVKMLCAACKSSEALSFLDSQIKTYKIDPSTAQRWYDELLRGMKSSRAAEEDVNSALQSINSRGMGATEFTRSQLVQYYAGKDDLKKALQWLETPISGKADPSGQAAERIYDITAILESCIRLRDNRTGMAILDKYLDQYAQHYEVWVLVFKFAAAVGRGVDEVERMMQVMANRKPSSAKWDVDIGMINELVKFAVDRKDPYLAERFISLGERRGVQPDATTSIYQMHYRISVDDVDGAIAAYERARNASASDANVQEAEREIVAMNQLIQAMCKVERRYSFEAVMRVVDDLNAKDNAQFQPATVACLVVLHLRREEYHDIVDLLQMHAMNYSISERHLVRDAMVDFCFDMRHSVAKVWDCYQIVRRIFDAETPREVRTRVMNQFYKRKRADMGFHVFSHMRDSPNPSIRANNDTYVDALLGVATCKDEESLEYVHNQLKLDPLVEPDTKINNALMLAYIGASNARKALEFWEDIVSSMEGPNYNSILIAFRACEQKPYGVDQGKVIWDMLIKLDIAVSEKIFTAWAACLIGNGFVKEAGELLKRADEFNLKIDSRMLGSVFSAARIPFVQKRVLALFREDYPDILEEMQNWPTSRRRDGTLKFTQIDSSLQP